MEELKILLENQFILRETNPELYYRIKDNYKNFKKFVVEKLGYELLIRADFIKLEKLPGRAEGWMGIEVFDDVKEYVFLMSLFMFLEDKNKEDQFLLSHITEFIGGQSLKEPIEWTNYKNRRSLIKVIRFALSEQLMKVTDGQEDSFMTDQNKEVLFESTGLSRYMPRSFSFDIMAIASAEELMAQDKALLRRYTVYRRLLLSPIVYNEGSEDEEYGYIKQNRNIIEQDFEKYLGWHLHVHRNGALVIPTEKDRTTHTFPGQGALHDIVLQMNQWIHEQILEKKIEPTQADCIVVEKSLFKRWVESLKGLKEAGWSKEYRESGLEKLYFEIVGLMAKFQMIKEREKDIIIYPLVSKVVGDYPKDFIYGGECLNE